MFSRREKTVHMTVYCVGLTLSQSLGLKEKKVIKVSQRERER